MMTIATIMTADRVRGSVPLDFIQQYAELLGFVEASDGVWLPSCDLEQYESGRRPFRESPPQSEDSPQC
jgi:hypothetical protein